MARAPGSFARDIDAVLAGNRSSHEGITLSPASLQGLPAEARLVLPSPNGSSIAFAAVNGALPVVAGCLRNAHAVARHLRDVERIGIVPAGEQWGDGSLRPAYEDLVGAGAVIERLTGEEPGVELSPEAEAAAAAFRWLRPLAECPSGIELHEKGYAEDVTIAEQVDSSDVVPVLVEGRFVAAEPARPGLLPRTARPAGAAGSTGSPGRPCRAPCEQLALAVQQVGQRGVDPLLAPRREPHVHAAAVVRVGQALDQAALLQPVDPVGHRAAT